MLLDVAVPPRKLRDHLLAGGKQVLTLDDVAQLTGLSRRGAADAMTRLRRAGHFFAPAAGLYVAIPPQYASWGAVPAPDFVDPLMRKLGRHYYVCLLSAAQLHGAAHQQPQVFQVMVDRAVPDRDFGRVRLRFYTRARLSPVPTIARNTATGSMRVATPEVTAFDLASRPNEAGGLSNAATVVGELALEAKLNAAALSRVVPLYPQAVVRRLGWLLDKVAADADTAGLSASLQDVLAAGRHGRPVDLLDPTGPRRGISNQRWGLVENADVEPDL
jgi:predicted transcriptional regulator of viral defense system